MHARPESSSTPPGWSPTSWRNRLQAHQVVYRDRDAADRAVARLAEMPPLVTSWEIERLKQLIAEAQEGRRFLLQGGDCAETLADCRPDVITSKLKILLQMSIVLVHGSKKPVIRVGRFAGQYARHPRRTLRRPVRQTPLQPHRNTHHRRQAGHPPQLLRRPRQPPRLQRRRA